MGDDAPVCPLCGTPWMDCQCDSVECGAAWERARIVAALIALAGDLAGDYEGIHDESICETLRYFAEVLEGKATPSPGVQRALEGGEDG